MPSGIAGEHEFPALGVVEREGEHAAQPVEEPLAPVAPAVQQHLGVARRDEVEALRLEFRPQRVKVVDLAVEDDPQAPVGRRHRLVAERREVDDREPAVAEADASVRGDPGAGVVGSAVALEVAQALEQTGLDRSAAAIREDACNAAHDETSGGPRSLPR